MNRMFTLFTIVCAMHLFAPAFASAVTIDRPPVSMAAVTPVATWTGANNTNWADAGNWSGTVPGAIGTTTNADTAFFNQNAMNSPLTIDAGRNVQNITFDTANVNSLSIGTLGGPALLLTAGGTIQTTSTVVSPQAVDAPLVLEGNYTFTSGASNSSRATLDFGGGITPGTTSGTTTLTLNGGNTGTNTISGVLADNGPGQLAVTMSGTGLWVLSGANTYSGGTTINSGTLVTTGAIGVPFSARSAEQETGTLVATDGGALGVGPLTINAANNITSVLNLGSDEFISNVTINQSGTGAATVNVAAGATLTSTGAFSTTGTFISVGPGTLEIGGHPTLNDNSHLNLTSGTLRFSAKQQGTVTIGTGVTVTIATGATLELDDKVAASGSSRVNIINNGQRAFGGMFLVSRTGHQVGAIDGTGDTVVNDGSDLTADHIIQNALIIGGAAGNPSLVTIAASDASGNPLDAARGGPLVQSSGLVLASSLTPSGPFGAVGISPADLSGVAVDSMDLAVPATANSAGFSDALQVPEPSTLLLALLAVLGVVSTHFARYRLQRQTV